MRLLGLIKIRVSVCDPNPVNQGHTLHSWCSNPRENKNALGPLRGQWIELHLLGYGPGWSGQGGEVFGRGKQTQQLVCSGARAPTNYRKVSFSQEGAGSNFHMVSACHRRNDSTLRVANCKINQIPSKIHNPASTENREWLGHPLD